MVELGYYTAGSCKHRDYRANREQRIVDMAEELQVDDLYIAMFALKSHGSGRRRAAKFLARVKGVTEEGSGLYGVKLNIHNVKNQPALLGVTGLFEEGFLQTPDSQALKPIEEGEKATIISGHLEHYYPDIIERELQDILVGSRQDR